MAKKKHKLGYLDIDVNQLVKADWNYKEDDKELSKKLKKNIEEEGIIQNLIVRELGDKYEVVNGNHRLDVMNDLGITKVHVYNYGKISKNKAMEVAIKTNETAFKTNALKLGETFSELTKEYDIDYLADSLPFKKQEITNMIELLEFDWTKFDDDDELDLEEPDPFNHTIKLKVTKEVYENWINLKKRMFEINGYDNDSKVIEFAIIEALNIPLESLK
tara:strand:+ start:333 stop:986 length:654 start_codon:yes stop_codon:yes gene_type:complete